MLKVKTKNSVETGSDVARARLAPLPTILLLPPFSPFSASPPNLTFDSVSINKPTHIDGNDHPLVAQEKKVEPQTRGKGGVSTYGEWKEGTIETRAEWPCTKAYALPCSVG